MEHWPKGNEKFYYDVIFFYFACAVDSLDADDDVDKIDMPKIGNCVGLLFSRCGGNMKRLQFDIVATIVGEKWDFQTG